jgi:hypothetical protein
MRVLGKKPAFKHFLKRVGENELLLHANRNESVGPRTSSAQTAEGVKFHSQFLKHALHLGNTV